MSTENIEKKKINFVIWAPPYSVESGGGLALHKLADLITQNNEKCYIYSSSKNPLWSGELITKKEFDNLNKNQTVVIYPEVVYGNPLGSKYVVRWLLNSPGVVGGDENYNSQDLVYTYWPYFSVKSTKIKIVGQLRALDFSQNSSFTNNNLTRQGQCYVTRKGVEKKHNQHNADALCLDNKTIKELPKIFNEKETFISYDHASYISVLAALAGCISIVIPDGISSKGDWKKALPIFEYGIAYGFEDIEWAKQTQHQIQNHLENLEKESEMLVSNFINDCYSKTQA